MNSMSDTPAPQNTSFRWVVYAGITCIMAAILFIVYKSSSPAKEQLNVSEDLKQKLSTITANLESEQNLLQSLEKDPEVLAIGRRVYQTNCSMCHGTLGEGRTGPNLTDEYWLHGTGDVNEVYKLIQKGVLDKGMPAWENIIHANDTLATAIFVQSLRGTHPPNAKAPQGEKISQ